MPAGTNLPGMEQNTSWMQVTLPDLSIGYAKMINFPGTTGDTRKDIVKTAERYLGTTYLWGGKTGFGFDCSGFVQTVFWLNDIHLPRDAWQQAEYSRPLSGDEELQPGDLVFFTSNDKIDHVGIMSDDNRFIHCSGWTRINSLDKEAPDFHPRLSKIYTGAHRVIQD